jgi:hypothetical protein
MLVEENGYLNRLIELLSTQQDQEDYFQSLLRDKYRWA